MPVRVLHSDRSLEWFFAAAMLSLAFTLAQPGDTLAVSPAFAEFERYGLTEPKLAGMLGIIGGCRITALYINGRWPKTPLIRMLASSIGALIWTQIAWIQAVGSLDSAGAISLGPGVFGLFALAEIVCVYRAAFDARYHRR